METESSVKIDQHTIRVPNPLVFTIIRHESACILRCCDMFDIKTLYIKQKDSKSQPNMIILKQTDKQTNHFH